MSANQPIAVEDDRDSEPPEPTVTTTQKIMTLGRYRLVVELASGGMATVFLARAEGPAGFEKLVALKRIHPHLAKEKSFVDMFLDEARIASRIHHPSVCTVFDFGAADDTYYIAMEYLVGEPLSRVCKSIATHPELSKSDRLAGVAARIVADACEGLHAAHELRGKDGKLLDVVHRDVSPQNLFIAYDGHVKVVDFGIASATDRLHHTATGQIKGKFGYMAPEQAQARNPDRRADVWSLGVVLWEMLTLKRLFRRPTTAQTLYAVLSDEVPPPSAVRPGIPPELDAIVLKAVCRDMETRYATTREFGRDLVKFIAKTGETVGPADLADWMDRLFPDGKKRKQQLIDSASSDEGTVIDIPSPVVDEASNSSTSAFQPGDIVRRAVASGEIVAGAVPAAAGIGRSSTLQTVAVRDRRLGKAGLLIGLFLVVAISAGLGWAFGGHPPDPHGTLADNGVTPRIGGAPAPTPNPGVTAPQTGQAPAPNPPGPTLPGGSPVTPTLGSTLPPNGTGTGGTSGTSPTPGTTAGHPNPNTIRPHGPVHPHTPGTPTHPGGGTTPIEAHPVDPHPVDPHPVDPHPVDPHPADPHPPDPGPGPGTHDPVPTTGRVTILTPGAWARVWDEHGRLLGETPVRTTMPVGQHVLSMRPYGQPPARSVTVVVTAGGLSVVNEHLPPPSQ